MKTPSGLTPAQAEKFRQVEAARMALASLEQMHRAQFVGPSREVAQMAKLPKFHKLLMTAEKQALRGVKLRDRSARRAARAGARQRADAWAGDLLALAINDVEARQKEIDANWQALHSNDPETVSVTLTTEFAHLGRSIRVGPVEEGEVGLTTTVPPPDVVPTSKPAVTPRGAPTLHKLNKSERAEWHARVTAAHVLLAAKEAFALAPGLTAARVVAVDRTGAPIVAARITRAEIERADWSTDAWSILWWLDPHLRHDARGRTRELRTIDLRGDELFGSLIR